MAFCDVKLDNSQNINQSYLSVKENYLFSVKKSNEVNFITTSPLQVVSLATALIPFLYLLPGSLNVPRVKALIKDKYNSSKLLEYLSI